jgi:hypothetical protein
VEYAYITTFCADMRLASLWGTLYYKGKDNNRMCFHHANVKLHAHLYITLIKNTAHPVIK